MMRSDRMGQSRSLDYTRAREKMVKEQIIGRGIQDRRVIEAMLGVPRHLFLPEGLIGRAYGDTALPIGDGQTITQPYMVAFLGQALGLRGTEKVLEIGTGSGYQAAVLACLADRVYSVERVRSLLERARKAFDRVHCHNVVTQLSDGSYGWKEEAPFDAILLSCAADDVPKALWEQLGENGRMILPLGTSFGYQQLVLLRKRPEGQEVKDLIAVSFVPLR